MKTTINNISVNTQSINSSLNLEVDIEYIYGIEAPLSISGTVSCAGRILSKIEHIHLKDYSEHDLITFDQKTYEERSSGGSKNKYTNHFQLTTLLSNKALDYLEAARNKHQEKSVDLRIEFLLTSLSIIYKPINSGGPQNGDSILRIKHHKPFVDYVIKQSDWINHFSSQLGLGKFLLLELNIPNTYQVTKYWQNLYEKLIQNLIDTENSLKNGDWYHAMFHLRKFYENSKIGDNKPGSKKFKAELDLVLDKDNHSEKGKQEFYEAMWKLFEYFSKYIHEKDHSGNIKPQPVARKEDAYFGYSLAVGLLNLIGAKLSRSTSG